MDNPIFINSANIIQFGLGITFDIGLNKITFDSSSLTTYISGNAGNVQGIYLQVFDASGLEVKTLDFTTPDIDPSAPAIYTLQLANGFAQYGVFIINAYIVDQDSTQYKIGLRKNICTPAVFVNGSVPGSFITQVNCDAPKVILSETTNFSYQGLAPYNISKSGNLYYPQGTLSPLAFTFTPFEITGDTAVYTGPYRINNTTSATYDLGDNVFVLIKYYTLLDFEVRCNSYLDGLLCCVEEVQNTYLSDPNSARGRDAKNKFDQITIPLITALVQEKAGKDSSAQIKIISDILQCDCACSPQSVEPVLLTGDNAGPSFSIIGQYGTSVTSAVVGSSTQYTVGSKTTTVTKDSGELGISIQTITTAGNVTYKIIINYDALAANILTTIGNSEDLLNQLNALITATGTGVSLDGLNGACVIEIGNCDYLLIEPSTPAKTVTSITIDSTVHNAPGGLLLTSTSSVASWLNGLSLGTFTVNSGSGNITIQSTGNSHNITQLALVIGGQPTLRQFTKTCVGLVQVLNAIINYICAIDTTQIQFGVEGQTVITYDEDGNPTVRTLHPDDALSAVLIYMLAAENKLYADLSAVSLTCNNVKVVFPARITTIVGTDFILGTKGGLCARLSFTDLAGQMLAAISGNPTLTTTFCNMVAACTAPFCSPPTNVSGVLTTGPNCVQITNITGSSS
jgi:hypothetical protein